MLSSGRRTFNTSWEKVFHSVEYIVDWGIKHRCLDKIKAIGVDEMAYQSGHKYLTVVYQIDNGCTRLLWIGQERTEETIRSYLLTQEFQLFWDYVSPHWAGK